MPRNSSKWISRNAAKFMDTNPLPKSKKKKWRKRLLNVIVTGSMPCLPMAN